MARIVFESDISAPASQVVAALDSAQGIAGWWTDQVDFAGGVGSTMTLGFPAAPVPFHLRTDEVGDDEVHWSVTGDFPPHWVGTTVIWTLASNDDGSTKVHFSHDGWATDEGPFASSALTWAVLQGTLKSYVETGESAPLFTAG